MNTIGTRIKFARDQLGHTQKEFSETLEISRNAILKYEQDIMMPGGQVFIAIHQHTGINPTWLLLGEGDPFKTTQPTTQCDVDTVMIPKVAARLAAGMGSIETDGKNIGMYSFRSDWIHKKGNVSQMVLMDVTGDSMLPDIKNGDMVLIDQGKTDILAYGYYAVGVEDAIYIKELRTKPGQLILHSLNKEYEDIIVDTTIEQLSPVRIIGRVIWWCREAV